MVDLAQREQWQSAPVSGTTASHTELRLSTQAGWVPGVTLMIDMPFPSYPDNFGHWAEALLPVYNVLAQVRRRFTLSTRRCALSECLAACVLASAPQDAKEQCGSPCALAQQSARGTRFLCLLPADWTYLRGCAGGVEAEPAGGRGACFGCDHAGQHAARSALRARCKLLYHLYHRVLRMLSTERQRALAPALETWRTVHCADLRQWLYMLSTAS